MFKKFQKKIKFLVFFIHKKSVPWCENHGCDRQKMKKDENCEMLGHCTLENDAHNEKDPCHTQEFIEPCTAAPVTMQF